MFFVYVLKSLRNGRFYIGQTNNLTRRYEQHQSGKVVATRYHRPYKLVFHEVVTTRTDAVSRELFFKSGQGRQLLKSMGL